MAKVHPKVLSSSSCHFTSKQETFTIWMKSLVLNGNGCTVYDSDGEILYRVDNYNHKKREDVHLMDLKGNTLFIIIRKKVKFSTYWEGYSSSASENNQKKPSFQVRQTGRIRIPKGVSFHKAILGLNENQPYCYKIESSKSKPCCKIIDQLGGIVAELNRKKSSCGIDLGDDVLSMVVEPNTDLSLVMGLVVAYSLISRKM